MVRANRIDARVVDKERKRVAVIEMSCPRMDNRAIKDAVKTAKYGPLSWELNPLSQVVFFQPFPLRRHRLRSRLMCVSFRGIASKLFTLQ